VKDIAFNDKGDPVPWCDFVLPDEDGEGIYLSPDKVDALLAKLDSTNKLVADAEDALIRRVLGGRRTARAILSRFCAEAIRVQQMTLQDACLLTGNCEKAMQRILRNVPLNRGV